jgi:molybdopterin/thiamine biosynthesis adenylyltransferase
MKKDLLDLCRQRGLTEEDLDELVHEAAAQAAMPAVNKETSGTRQEGILDSAEQSASRVNNEGLEAQIDCLIRQYGDQEARKLLEAAEHEP